MTPRMLLAMLVSGLLLLAIGQGMSNKREARESGMEPIALLVKGAGLVLLASTLYRFILQDR